jgi:hypothetical protein
LPENALIVLHSIRKLCWHEAPSDEIDVKGEAIMRQSWVGVLRSDPYNNPNLSRERADFR